MTKKYFFITITILIMLLTINTVQSDLTCTITNTTDCTDTILLKLWGYDGYNNAHSQLHNYTPNYDYSLCCNSTNQILGNNCADENAVSFLRLMTETNSHVQSPNSSDVSGTIYDFPACLTGVGTNSCWLEQSSCSNDAECTLSIASTEYNDGDYNYTNAHVAECGYYDLKVCCLVNSPPNKPILIYPEHEDYFFTNRTPTFNWSSGGDPDGDSVTHHLQISTNPEFSSFIYNVSNLALEYSVLSPLELGNYYWRVRSNDSELYGEWSDISNFTLKSSLIITLVESNVTFGLMEVNTSNDTTNDAPTPFLFRNDGNVYANLTNVSAEKKLFENAALNNDNWQIKARTNTSFNAGQSILTWTNIPGFNAPITGLVKEFNYADGNDLLDIDIKVTVPPQEPPGAKAANITFVWRES